MPEFGSVDADQTDMATVFKNKRIPIEDSFNRFGQWLAGREKEQGSHEKGAEYRGTQRLFVYRV